MLKVTLTPNLAGVFIAGDYDEFCHLAKAFHEITIHEDDENLQTYYDMSTRALALCYDVRKAYMGHREIVMESNHLSRDMMKAHELIAPEKNVYYGFPYLYPEMCYTMMALNKLIGIRIGKLQKGHAMYGDSLDKFVVWDETILRLRTMQAAFSECMRGTLAPNFFTRWLKEMNDRYVNIGAMAEQYVDELNYKHLKMNRARREKNLISVVRKLRSFQYDSDYQELKQAVAEAAKEYNCPECEIEFPDMQYNEEIDW